MRELVLIAPGLAARRASPHHTRLALPALDRLLTLGASTEAAASTADALCRGFAVARQQDAPLAPLGAARDGLQADEGYWLRADPVHLQVGMRGLTLLSAAHIGIAAAESHALAAALAPIFAAAGWQFHAPQPDRWYVRLATPPRLATTPLDQVATRHVNAALPAGPDAAAIMQIVNEAQMLLHAHPTNLAREARGQPAVNSLWLWGGGEMPEIRRRWRRVHAADADAHALAARAGADALPCPPRLAALPRAEDAIVVLPECPPDANAEDLARLEADWFRPLLRALRLGRIRRLALALPGPDGACVELGWRSAWKFAKRG